MALTNKLTAIANAIREKTGDTATMTLDEMPQKIQGISGASFSISVGDSISVIYCNSHYDPAPLSNMLQGISYPEDSLTIEWFGEVRLIYNSLLDLKINDNATISLCTGRLIKISDSSTIANVILDLDYHTPHIIFSDSEFDSSSTLNELKSKQGMNVEEYSLSHWSASPLYVTNILSDFLPIKDNYFAKSKQAFGEFYTKSEVLENLQEKTMTLGENEPTVITPDSPYFGLSKVTPAIDSTIINRNNIKKNSYILGIKGDVAEFPSGAWYVFHTSESKVDDIGRTYYKIFEVLEGTFSNTSHACTYAMISNTLLSSWQSQFSELSGSMGLFYGEAGHSVGEYVDIDFAHFIT